VANVLRCTSSGYSYTFTSGISQIGSGATEEDAQTAALAAFPKDAPSQAAWAAITDAMSDSNGYQCEGPCVLVPTLGAASIVQTNKQVAGTPPNVTVTVTLTMQVPVTLACVKRTVSSTIALADDPIGNAVATVSAVPIGDLVALAPFRQGLLALGVTNLGDLLLRSPGGKARSGC
jgi:hypothetical protein